MKFYKFYISFIILFTSQLMLGQIDFKTSVSKNKLGLNQKFKIEFTVNKQGADNFKAPAFSNFEIIGGPSSSVNQSWINGKTSYTQSYIYVVQPKKIGDLIIGSATIEYKGKIFKSDPVKITVTEEVEIPKDVNDPYYIAQQNLHLVAEVSKLNPFVGEGIYVVYKLFVSRNISVNDWRVTESPEYNSFWNQDIEVKNLKARNGKYNGEDYRYLELKRAILIPQKSGKLVINPMKMDFSVGVPTGRGDFFGNMITKNINFSTASAVRVVNAQGLPEAGKPLGFTGAVGEFEFEVSLDKNTLKANDAAQIKVEVSGRGNLKLFEAPKITTPPELEVYTPEHEEEIATSLVGLRGRITDFYTVVPQYKGKYKIPEVTFSYFNPKEKKYRSITSDAVIVNVTEGKENPSRNNASTSKQDIVVASDNNFRYIALDTDFQPKVKKIFLKSQLFYMLLFLPFLAIPIGLFIGKRRADRASDVQGNKIRKADRLARRYLSQAKKQLGKREAFYIALEKALHNFLKAKLQLETSDISKEKIVSLLQERDVDKSIIDEFIEVLDDCDFARYTPTTDHMMKNEFEKAKMVIAQLDRKL